MIFTLQPGTRARMEANGLEGLLQKPSIQCVPPLMFHELVSAKQHAHVVIAANGGLQEETTALGIPCLTVGDNTECPITIHECTKILVGSSPAAINKEIDSFLSGNGKAGQRPELWDRRAVQCFASAVSEFFAIRAASS